MIVRYWHPFQEVDTLRRQLDRVFDEVTNVMDPTPTGWTPAIRLVEAGDAYRLTVPLVGINPDHIDIQATREAVVIAGDRPQPEAADGEQVLHDDLRYGAFRRVVNLPEAIRNDAIDANFENGLLTLRLPKVEAARNQVVKISLGQTSHAPTPTTDAETAETPEA